MNVFDEPESSTEDDDESPGRSRKSRIRLFALVIILN